MRKIRNPNRADLIALAPASSPVAAPGAPAAATPLAGGSGSAQPAQQAAAGIASALPAATSGQGVLPVGLQRMKAETTPCAAEAVRGMVAEDKGGVGADAGAVDAKARAFAVCSMAAATAAQSVCDNGGERGGNGDANDGAGDAPRGSDPQRYERGLELTRRYALLTAGTGCIPLPAADILSGTALQAALIEELSKLYGHTPTPGWSLRLAGLLVFSTGWSAVGQAVTWSFAKMIPGAGTLIGIGGLAAYTAATTYALGRSVIHHYEKGGRPESIVCASVARDFRDGLSAGKEFWQSYRGKTGAGGK